MASEHEQLPLPVPPVPEAVSRSGLGTGAAVVTAGLGNAAFTSSVQRNSGGATLPRAASPVPGCHSIEPPDATARALARVVADRRAAVQRKHDDGAGGAPAASDTGAEGAGPGDEAYPVAPLWLDALGWVGDLGKTLGWPLLPGAAAGGTRADSLLLHNMLGNGEQVTVPPEWVQGAADWVQAWNLEINVQVNTVAREQVLPAATSGTTSGEGHFSGKAEGYAKPDTGCTFESLPGCPGADQFLGSGGARFTIEASYRWEAEESSDGSGGYSILIEVYDLSIEYEDRYAWGHDDPGQQSRQLRGWYTPFKLKSTWVDPPQTWRGVGDSGGRTELRRD